jgi:bifunctional DNase/RNase
LIEVFVESIRVNMANYKRVVMLKEKHSTRYLPIWIGHFEADAIAIPMQKVPVSRPLTHDLLRLAISALGARLERVIINDLADETFYAKLILDQDGKAIEVDARPSDAIALAIRTEVPIFVEEKVLDTAGMVFDGEADAEGAEPKEHDESIPIDEEKLSVFRQFINSMDIDDIEKGGEGKQ